MGWREAGGPYEGSERDPGGDEDVLCPDSVDVIIPPVVPRCSFASGSRGGKLGTGCTDLSVFISLYNCTGVYEFLAASLI